MSSSYDVLAAIDMERVAGHPVGGGRCALFLSDEFEERQPLRQDDDEFTRRSRLSWAQLIRRVYEVPA